MHDQVKEGDVLTISEPRNHFPLHSAPHTVLLAGGIGITPLLCMAERLAVLQADFSMHYGSRSASRAAFVDRIRASAFAHRVAFHFDDGDAQQQWDLAVLLASPAPGTHLYVCGPQGFMQAVLTQARDLGWPQEQLHYEYFAAPAVDTQNDGAFEVQLASSGRVIAVARDVSITQALSAAGVDLPTACEQGVCGTCMTRVIQGVPDHRDSYLTPEERAANDQMTPCCSRSLSPLLVLDL